MKIIIYVLCVSKEQYDFVSTNYCIDPIFLPIRIPSSFLCENVAFFSELPRRLPNWKNADFIGTISATYHLRNECLPIDLINTTIQTYSNANFIAFNHCEMDLLEQAELYHPGFIARWNLFAKTYNELSYPLNFNKTKPGFLNQFFVTTPEDLLDYCHAMQKLLSWFYCEPALDPLYDFCPHISFSPQTPEQLATRFGFPHFSFHPFILERFACVWFNNHLKISKK